MSKVMLINATRPSEVRAAILNHGKLDSLEIEVRDAALQKGNIFLGRIANVENSLNACFVEFGADKQGFLPIDEIHPSCYAQKWKGEGKPRIGDVVRKGHQLIVQVVKDAIGNKGAALTTKVSLAGRYIVLMPMDDNRGVSRKISSDSQRKKIKEIASSLKVPAEFGFIVRTAGIDRTKTDLNRDVALLVRTWKDIQKQSKGGKAPKLLHADGDLIIRMLRDYYSADVKQVIIDQGEAFDRAQRYFKRTMPRTTQVLTQYIDRIPLFTRYRVEQQIEDIFARRADLPSGGYILIDPTEALIAVDVNSGRSTRQKSQEDTALHTNLEAAREVARQLRLRDLGGLIVVDFIDMPTKKANKQVEKVLKDALKDDKARTYISRISDNGLLEINRQRLKQALSLQTHRECPTCDGRGIIPSPQFVANNILRSIEAKAANGTFAKVTVSLHPELADHLQNTHRREIMDLEERFGVLISIEGRPGLHRGEQRMDYEGLGGLAPSDREWVERQRERLEAERTGVKPEPKAEVFEEEDDDDETLMAELDEMLAREAAEKGEDDDEAPKKKRRRRRRRRRKGGDDGTEAENEPSAEEEEADDESEQHDDDDDAQEDEDSDEELSRSQKRRLRRKRRRTRKGSEAEEATDEGTEAEDGTDQVEADAEPPAAVGDEDDEGSASDATRRKRRRRRRRRSSSSSDGEASAESAPRPTLEPEPTQAPGQVLAAPPVDGLFAEESHAALSPVETHDDPSHEGAGEGEEELIVEAAPYEEESDEPGDDDGTAASASSPPAAAATEVPEEGNRSDQPPSVPGSPPEVETLPVVEPVSAAAGLGEVETLLESRPVAAPELIPEAGAEPSDDEVQEGKDSTGA